MDTLPPLSTSEIPKTMLSTTLERQTTNPESYILSSHVMDLLRDINKVNIQFEMLQLWKIESRDADSISHDLVHLGRPPVSLSPAHEVADNSRHRDYIYESCRLAATISWHSMCNTVPFAAAENQQHVWELKAALSNVDDVYWIRVAPEAFIWVCLTGAVAASDIFQRAWFIAKGGTAAMALGPEEQNIL